MPTTDASASGALPAPVSSFVGRTDELALLRAALAAHRLVTVTGPGGAGKTRLAIEAASTVQSRVVYTDLTRIQPSGPVAAAVAEAAGVHGATGPATLGEFRWWLDSGRATLIVLDNAEHVLDEARAFSVGVLEQVPSATILLTSRRPLAILGEVLVPLGAMSPEDADALFWARAEAVRPDVPQTTEAREAARTLCERLDRLPLALELAAARMRVLTPGELLPLIAESFEALGSGSPATPERHRTLRASIDSSVRALPSRLVRVLVRASVFASPFDTDAAAVVAGAGLDDLDDLVSRSLLQTGTNGQRTTFRELESVRDHARVRLASGTEVADARDAHLGWLCGEFDADAYPTLARRARNAEAIERLPELRAALDHAVDADPGAGLRLLAATSELWFRVAQDECLERADLLLRAYPRIDETRSAGLLTRAWMLIADQRLAAAAAALEEALAQTAPDGAVAANCWFFLAVARFLTGDFTGSRQAGDASLAVFTALGDVAGQGRAVGTRATGLALAGRSEEALRVTEQALELSRKAGDIWSQGQLQTYGGLAESDLGRIPAARTRLFDAVHLFNRIGDISLMGIALGRLAALETARDPVAALRAAGSANRRQGAGGRYHPVTTADIAAVRAAAAEVLDEREFRRVWEAGERLTFAEAAAGLEALDAAPVPHLTAREVEVARLVGQGLTNAAIARRLVLSERTVENHVARAMAKADVGNRTALAAWLAAHAGPDRAQDERPHRN